MSYLLPCFNLSGSNGETNLNTFCLLLMLLFNFFVFFDTINSSP